MSFRLLVSCGEPSGDLYAAALVGELQRRAPDAAIFGLGGPQLAAAGGRLLADYRGLAVTGLTEAVTKLPRSFDTLRRLVAAVRHERPDALIAIDFPDFNFPLARRVRRLGVPVVYYISPQVWAWRRSRIQTIRTLAERMLVIFPFEEDLYRRSGVPVEFVGHPLVDLAKSSASRTAFLSRLGLAVDAPTVAVLPGSRPNEVQRMLPTLVRAAERIQRRIGAAQFVIARAPNLDDELFSVGEAISRTRLRIVEGETDNVLGSADLALTASGTATVQCALHDTPMVVVYALSPLTYRVGRRFVKVDTFAMVNLIAGERIVPELIQEAFTAENVAAEAVSLLSDPSRADRMRAGLAIVRTRLGGAGASGRAAEAILKVIAGCRSASTRC